MKTMQPKEGLPSALHELAKENPLMTGTEHLLLTSEMLDAYKKSKISGSLIFKLGVKVEDKNVLIFVGVS